MPIKQAPVECWLIVLYLIFILFFITNTCNLKSIVTGGINTTIKKIKLKKLGYSQQILKTLHQRAVNSASAWVDDLDDDYLDYHYTSFDLSKQVARVTIKHSTGAFVIVLFIKKHGCFYRKNIYYKGVLIK